MEIWQIFNLYIEEKLMNTSFDRQIIALFQEIGVVWHKNDSDNSPTRPLI